jgi:predicted O-methyltransferase YrrM
MVNYYRPEKILEMGTSLGITTLYLSTPNQNARVITLEGCPETMRLAKEHFDKLNAKNITPVVGEFSSTLPDALSKLGKLDFLYLDGNHSYKPTLDYFEQCLPYCHEDSILVLDDIHLNKGMEQAWDEIRNHQKVTIGIDLFKLGIVFFKSGMPKQQFTLKF